MKTKFWFSLVGAASLLAAVPAFAHCDSLDGPVVNAAQRALTTGNPDPVLIWVRPSDEAEIRTAFQETLSVRKQGGAAAKLADRYFFETLVRVHRAGEGAAYTGLKPAGQDLGPALPLADKAIQSGSIQDLTTLLTGEITQSLQVRFDTLRQKQNFKPDDLAAGRAYVDAYVSFIHFVEGVHEAATAQAEGHYPEVEHTAHHDGGFRGGFREK